MYGITTSLREASENTRPSDVSDVGDVYITCQAKEQEKTESSGEAAHKPLPSKENKKKLKVPARQPTSLIMLLYM
jgi:hypothetical protein